MTSTRSVVIAAAEPVAVPTPSWVVVGLAMGPAVALGLARFAYALLLPPMRAELGWSFAIAGAMNSGALSDGAGGVRAGLWLSVGILALATFVAVFQPEPPEER